jgi:hypothetical protein
LFSVSDAKTSGLNLTASAHTLWGASSVHELSALSLVEAMVLCVR